MDALEPFVVSFTNGEGLKEAIKKARIGVEATKGMKAVFGRAVYVEEKLWSAVPDPGAEGVLCLVEGLAEGLEKKFDHQHPSALSVMTQLLMIVYILSCMDNLQLSQGLPKNNHCFQPLQFLLTGSMNSENFAKTLGRPWGECREPCTDLSTKSQFLFNCSANIRTSRENPPVSMLTDLRYTATW